MNAQKSLFSDQTPTLDEIMSAFPHDSPTHLPEVWLTRKQIADKLGRSKSPALIAQLGILVGMGYLRRKFFKLPNGVEMYEYRPAQKWFDDGQLISF